jgi:molecular chaperone GrpE
MTQNNENQEQEIQKPAEQVVEEAKITESDNSSEDKEVNQKQEEANLKKIVDLEKAIIDLNDKLLRSLADLDNSRKRAREEMEKTSKYAIANFASDLVLVVENFFLATDNAPNEEIEKSPTIKNFADAIVMTKKELVKVLEKNSVTRIYPLGEKFDHHFHEALTQIESEGEEGIVVQVIQAGYKIADRLIRPALVGISKAIKEAENAS